MNEVQKIILTCLLGPEDPDGFKNFCKREESKIYRAENPEKCSAATLKSSREKRQRDPEAAREKVRSWRENNLEYSRALGRESNHKRRAENPEKIRAAGRKSYRKRKAENPEKMREGGRLAARVQRAKNPEKTRETAREFRRRETTEKREARLEGRRKKHSDKYAADFGYRLECCLRSRLLIALRVSESSKSARTKELCGCSIEQLKEHLQSQFKPGMTCENYGPVWHIDHIKPCAKFDLTDPEQQRICFHWTNLQPLFAAENISKGAKYVR